MFKSKIKDGLTNETTIGNPRNPWASPDFVPDIVQVHDMVDIHGDQLDLVNFNHDDIHAENF